MIRVGDTLFQKPRLALGSLQVGVHEWRVKTGELEGSSAYHDGNSEVEGVKEAGFSGDHLHGGPAYIPAPSLRPLARNQGDY